MKKNHILFAVSIFFSLVFLQACGTESSEGEASGTDNGEAGSSEAEGYPDRTIELVVGYGEGGGTDNFARLVGQKMSEDLGENINVVNQPGSRGAIAEEYVQNQPADGYTIWVATPDILVNVATDSTDYPLEDYTPLGRGQLDTYSIQTSSDSEFDDIDTLIDQAKENPGTITIGGTAADGFDELSVQRVSEELGIELRYVPYDEAGMMHSDVLGGHTDLMLEEIGPAKATIDSGDLDVLALFIDDEEVEGFEDVPTAASRDWNFTDGNTRSFYVKSDTPEEIINTLEESYEKVILENEEYLQYEEDNYLHIRENGYLNREDFSELNEELLEEYDDVLN